MSGSRIPAFLLGLLVAGTVFVGGYAAHDLVQGRTAALTLANKSDVYGDLQAAAHTNASSGIVPFFGPFKKGQCGPAIRLMEGALRRLPKPVRTAKAANCFGKATKAEVITFQKRLHYKPTGVYNLVTHKQLVKRGGYNNEARRDLIYIATTRLKANERHNVLVITAHAVLVGAHIPYTQGSERTVFPAWPRIPPATDCSGFVTWVLYQAGDGAAVGYFGPGSPVGWTGTLDHQGVVVPPNKPLQVGDLVFYPSQTAPGPPWGHVAIYIGHGMVASHGGPGIHILPYNYRAVGQVRRYI